MKKRHLVLMAATFLALAGCGGNNTGSQNPDSSPATSLADSSSSVATSVSQPSSSFAKIGVSAVEMSQNNATLDLSGTKTVTLTVTVSPSNAEDKSVTWASSDSTVASVASGVVTALKVGTTTITATANSDSTKKASCIIIVTDSKVSVTGVTLSENSIELDTYPSAESKKLTATIEPDNASNKGIRWASGNLGIATVDQNGLVTAVAAGQTVVRAISKDDSTKYADCTVTVVDSTPEPDKYIFEACDYRVVTDGNKNKGQNCIGARYNSAEDNDLHIKYTVNAAEAGNYGLAFTVSKCAEVKNVNQVYSYKINGEEKTDSTAKMSTEGELWSSFHTIDVGTYALNQGENTIEITYDWDSTGGSTTNFRNIVISGYSVVTLVEPPHTCQHVCEYCGNCLDPDCEFSACSVKCTCIRETYTFNATEYGKIYGDLEANTAGNYVTNKSPYLYGYVKYTINAEKAGTANLAVTISGNEQASWTVCDYFRIWVNAGNETAWANDEKSEILSGTTHTAATVQGSRDVFSTIAVGAVDLVQGENTVVIGWSAVGNSAYAFKLRDIGLTTVSNSLTAATEHHCTSVCDICGKCRDLDCEEEACADKCHCGDIKSNSMNAVDLPNIVYTGSDASTADGIDTENNYYTLVGTGVGQINYLEFKFLATKATTAAIYLNIKNPTGQDIITTDGNFNSKFCTSGHESTPTVITASMEASNDFQRVKLGVVQLASGSATQEYNIFRMWIQNWSGDMKVRSIEIVTDSTNEITFPYTEHVCQHKCDVCGGCTDLTCYDVMCSRKCTCPKLATTELLSSDFYAVHNLNNGNAVMNGEDLSSVQGALFHFKAYFKASKAVENASVYMVLKTNDGSNQSFNVPATSGQIQLGYATELGTTPEAPLGNAANSVTLNGEFQDVKVGNLSFTQENLSTTYGYLATWLSLPYAYTIHSIKIVAPSDVTFTMVTGD